MIDAKPLRFQQQIDYFNKKVNVKTNSYLDVMGDEHDYLFMVAGAHRNEIVHDLRVAVDKAINQGTTLEEFRKDFDKVVAKHSWSYNGGHSWRTRIIYDTNVYASYNKGRLAQHLDLKEELPYWEYIHNDNDNPRKEHMDWDNMILPADDPWWRYHYPVKAYGCHCEVVAHDATDLQRMGRSINTAPPVEFVDKLVGTRSGAPRTVTIPTGYDVGFEPHDFSKLVGGDKHTSVDKLLFQKMVSADPLMAAIAISNVLERPGATRLLNESFTPTVNKINTTKQAAGEFHYVGVIPEPVIKKLTLIDRAPQSAVIGMRGEDILHAVRDAKQAHGIALPLDFWVKLPENLRTPLAILLQPKESFRDDNNAKDTLLFIYQTEQGKVAIKMDYLAKIPDKKTQKKGKYLLNIVKTGSLMKDYEFQNLGKEFQLLWGELP